jgi:hypothetical protein
MLAYPFAYDQSVFAVGGEMAVKNGAIEYRDFIDTKPPIIFLDLWYFRTHIRTQGIVDPNL